MEKYSVINVTLGELVMTVMPVVIDGYSNDVASEY